MDRKTFTIILAVVLLGSFFLAYLSYSGRSISGYDMVFSTGDLGGWRKYLMLLIPLSGLLLLLGAFNGNYILGRNVLCWLPLLTLIFFIFIDPLIDGTAIGDIFKNIGKIYGIGMWLTIAGALLLAFYTPKVSKA